MASLKDIRVRINSVRNTQKTTRAMQMVSAAKLKRSQDAIEQAAPYAEKLRQMVSKLSARVSVEDHPLLKKGTGSRTLVIFVSSDRGLCGGFNSNLYKSVANSIKGIPKETLQFTLIGRKGRDLVQRGAYDISDSHCDLPPQAILKLSQQIADTHIKAFLTGEVDRVFIAFNRFKNVLVQQPVFLQLLPIQPPEEVVEDTRESIFEPSPEDILSALLELYVRNQVYTACLSSFAGEHASRMTAMDSATKNAGEMIKKLKLYYNRTRQAAITRELIEIVSGAESL